MTSALAQGLRARVRGRVHAAGDDGYAAEVAGFNTAIRHSADLVLAAASDSDVVEAVHFARAHRLPVGVHTTGHGGLRATADGLLVSTRALDRVDVDPVRREAIIGGGARWAAVVTAAGAHG